MEMHQIRYFLAVARTLNFTRAADLCNVTQPSLTRAIQKLEDEFGGLLFHRERSMTHLTELGRMVLPHLEQTFEAAEAASALAGSLGRAEVAPLVMGVARGLDLPRLDEVIGALAGSLPGLALDLRRGSSEELIEQALRGGIDLLLVALPEDAHDRLDTWPLFEMTWRVAFWPGHRLDRAGPVALDEALEEPFIDTLDDGADVLRGAAAGVGRDPTFRHRAEGQALALNLIARRLGLAVVAETASHPGLVLAECADHPLRRRIVLAAIAGRKRVRAADAFVRVARALDWEDRPQPVPVPEMAAMAASTSAGSAR